MPSSLRCTGRLTSPHRAWNNYKGSSRRRRDPRRARWLVHPPLIARPIGLAQRALEQLAAGVARQRVDKIDRAGALKAGELVAAPFDQRSLGELGARAPH